MDLGRLVLIILLPFLLGKILVLVKALFHWRKHVVFCREKSTAEKLTLAVLAAFVTKLVYDIANPPLSYFSMTKTSIDSPAYMVRNKFRQYVQDRESEDPNFLEMLSYRKKTIQESTDSELQGKIYSPFKEIEEEYIELERLSMALRNNENRRLYAMFGSDGFKCEVCGKNSYYRAAVIAPSILKEYLLVFFAIGVVSIFPHKKYWRYILSLICVLLMAYEIFEWGFSESLTVELYAAPNDGNLLTRPEQMTSIRNIIFLIICLLAFVIDFSVFEDPVVGSLKLVVQSVEAAAAKLQLSRLARMATMGDDTLRKFCWDYYRKTEQQSQHLFNDPQYKKLQAELAQKYKMDELIQKSEETMADALDLFLRSKSE
jgi:hypothetical protein